MNIERRPVISRNDDLLEDLQRQERERSALWNSRLLVDAGDLTLVYSVRAKIAR